MRERSIIFVVNTLTHGGAEIQVSRLARGLKLRGWNVRVVTMVQPDALESELRQDGIDVHCLHMTPGVPNPLAIWRLARYLRRHSPAIVHSHIVHANLLARAARPFAHVPVLICTAHSYKEGGKIHDFGYRVTDWLCDLTTTVSQTAADRYRTERLVRPTGVRFVPNGLDTTLFSPDPAARRRVRDELELGDRFVWLVVARLEPDKNHDNLLNAFSKLRKETQAQPVLLVVGSGSLEQSLRDRVEALGLQDHVIFLGLRSDVDAVINASDAVVLSSSMEGMPLVLQEASAVGIPIVATDVGGNSEVVTDGITGLLVPAENSEALAQAMTRMMTLAPEQRRQMGNAGRELVMSRYSIENVLNLWEELYQQLWAQSTSAGADNTLEIAEKTP